MGRAIVNRNYYAVPRFGGGGFLSGAISGGSAGAAAGPFGLLAGSLIGGFAGSSSQDASNKLMAQQQAEQEKQRLAMQKRIDDENSRAILASYPTNGIAGASYYGASGGKLAIPKFGWGGDKIVPGTNTTTGGKLVPLSSDAALVKGDTHSEDTNGDGKTGVTLQDKQGRDAVEVENDEVIIGDKAFSNRLGFAKPAQALSTMKGAEEAKLKTGDHYAHGTATRNIQKIDTSLDHLYSTQEQLATELGLRPPTNDATAGRAIVNGEQTMAAYGGKLAGGGFSKILGSLLGYDTKSVSNYVPGTESIDENGNPTGQTKGTYGADGTFTPDAPKSKWVSNSKGSIFQAAAPFVDNITNADIIKHTPMIPVPTINKIVPGRVGYNINPQVNEAARERIAMSNDVANNTASSTTANALKAKLYADQLNSINKLYGTKNNVETAQFNENARNIQDVTNSNNAKVDQFNLMNMQRTNEIQGMRSANMANFSNDLTNNIKDQRNLELDNAKMVLNAKAASMDNDAAVRNTFDKLVSVVDKNHPDYLWLKGKASESNAGVAMWNAAHADDPTVLKTK